MSAPNWSVQGARGQARARAGGRGRERRWDQRLPGFRPGRHPGAGAESGDRAESRERRESSASPGALRAEALASLPASWRHRSRRQAGTSVSLRSQSGPSRQEKDQQLSVLCEERPRPPGAVCAAVCGSVRQALHLDEGQQTAARGRAR